MRYADYSTFPPTYSLIPPTVVLASIPSLVQVPCLPILKWNSDQFVPSTTQSLPWRLTSYPATPTGISRPFSSYSVILHPKVQYKILSSTISRDLPATYPSGVRPFGTSSSGTQLSSDMSQSEFDWSTMTTLFGNVTRMIADSVCLSSQQTYKTGWKRWLTFTATIGTDRYLQLVPPTFHRYVDQAHHAVQMSWAILACCGFLAYLVSHPTKPTSANSASKYLAAVRYNLKNSGMDITFIDSSSFLKSARAGCIKGWRALPGNSISDRQTLPISIGMLETAAIEFLNLALLPDLALYTAAICAYTLLCRVSEYLRRPTSDHHLRTQHVVFWIKHLNPADITDIRPFLYITSADVWQFPINRLAGVAVTIKDSKADQEGASDKYNFPRFAGIWPPNMVYDYSEVMYNFATRARPLHDQPFFSSSTGEKLKLTADSFNKWLKVKVAPRFGLNPARVHTHSLRFAGASTLAAGNISDSIIMKMGRWKSLAFLSYIRMAKEIFSRVAAALADRSVLPAADVRNLMPGI